MAEMDATDPPPTDPLPPDLPQDLIDTKEAARLMRTHISTVWRWVLKGKLRGWRRAGRMFVSRAELVGMFQRVTPGASRPGAPRPGKYGPGKHGRGKGGRR